MEIKITMVHGLLKFLPFGAARPPNRFPALPRPGSGKAAFRVRPRGMTVSMRLSLGFGITTALVMLLAGISLLQLKTFSQQMRTMSEVHSQRVAVVRQMQDHVADAYTSMLSLAVLMEKDELDFEVDLLKKSYASYERAFSKVVSLANDARASPALRQLITDTRTIGDAAWSDTKV